MRNVGLGWFFHWFYHRKKGFKLQMMGLFWWGRIFKLLKIEQLRTFLGFDGRFGGSKRGLRECSNWRTET